MGHMQRPAHVPGIEGSAGRFAELTGFEPATFTLTG